MKPEVLVAARHLAGFSSREQAGAAAGLSKRSVYNAETVTKAGRHKRARAALLRTYRERGVAIEEGEGGVTLTLELAREDAPAGLAARVAALASADMGPAADV